EDEILRGVYPERSRRAQNDTGGAWYHTIGTLQIDPSEKETLPAIVVAHEYAHSLGESLKRAGETAAISLETTQVSTSISVYLFNGVRLPTREVEGAN
ncbi:MAG TPA: hypothetical protein VFH60_00880, partial [Chloroflexia bacterium]|nr:hypothetical protein [Chloroflexia bacterium]